MSIDIFKDNWEATLDKQFLKWNRCLKKAYICSPLCAQTDMEMMQNMRTFLRCFVNRYLPNAH